ncbi:MAG: Phosphoglucosamine mutase [Acidobacteriaceae bacterium]|nr:Phosphoglucosamine mutase [Acidobacteriaceae bacterium]
MRKLFGTDGIRGVAGQYPLDSATTYLIGSALAHHLGGVNGKVRVVIGQDTRESSGWIADTLTAGLESAGAEVQSAGVVTTPAIAYLARTEKFSAGVVISASHNPWQDNGIKIFGHDGFKLADQTELEIEREIFSQLESNKTAHGIAKGRSLPGEHKLAETYERWLKESVNATDFSRLKVVADCANGAASNVAPELFRLCNINASFTHCSPTGRNINEKCGALHPEIVAAEVVSRKADIGVCFDGDADRALFSDCAGNVINGDAVLLLIAREMKSRNKLKADTVVATTMSNMGLEAALKRSGIKMLRAPVGDKYVLEEMHKTGAVLGGEQSGHIIFSDCATTGDGLMTALKVLEVVAKSGKSLAELVSDLKVFPQVIKNVRVREKKPLDQIPEVASAIKTAEQDLKDEGRVVVRYSGTEALCRVMIEAASAEKMQKHADAIAGAMQKVLGT